MIPVNNVIVQLKDTRERLEKQIEQINYALQSLASLNGKRPYHQKKKIHKRSRAARAHMAAAQKARWAKFKKAA